MPPYDSIAGDRPSVVFRISIASCLLSGWSIVMGGIDIPHPAVRHDTVSVCGHFDLGTAALSLIREVPFPPASGDPKEIPYAVQDRHFRLSPHPGSRMRLGG